MKRQPKNFYSMTHLAAALGIHRQTVRAMVERGEITDFIKVGKMYLFPRAKMNEQFQIKE